MISDSIAADLQRAFRRDGFAVVPDLASGELVAELGEAYNQLLDGTIPCAGTDRNLGGLTRQIMLPHLYHPAFASNAAVDNARDLVRTLAEIEDPQFFFSMLIYKPPGHPHVTPWHQDMAYVGKPFTPAGVRCPNDSVLQFWLALDDVDENMGCMEFIPGAFDAPMPPHIVASGDPDDDGRLLAIDQPAKWLDLARAVKCPLSAGSATVHGYATPHFTGPNRSTRGRRAFIFSFTSQERLEKMKRAAG